MANTTGTIRGDLAAAARGEWPTSKISTGGNGSNFGGLGSDPENDAGAQRANEWHDEERAQEALFVRLYEAMVGSRDADLAEVKRRLMVDLGHSSVEELEAVLTDYHKIILCSSCQRWFGGGDAGATRYRCGGCGSQR